MVRQRFLVPSLTGSSPVPAIVRLDKLHPFKMEEGQILYRAWYGVGALLMLMVSRTWFTWFTTKELWVQEICVGSGHTLAVRFRPSALGRQLTLQLTLRRRVLHLTSTAVCLNHFILPGYYSRAFVLYV